MTTQTPQQELEEYAALKTELAPMLTRLKSLEASIKKHVKDTGEMLECDTAYCTANVAQGRDKWDAKALKGYAVANPEIFEFYTKADPVTRVSIKMKEV